ncbi:MAG: 50S ribosomal protein L22 [Candidatus Cloacimonetes bacterium]|nr:50S ribosomal protein L22 [Candidatus Cloacimonadota bacterium]
MEAIARVRNLRGSARKARLVLDLIRGRSVNEAQKILAFSTKRASIQIAKFVKSAVANATVKEARIDIDSLFINEAFADDGPIMKRQRTRAQGRATVIRRRTCHITIGIKDVEQGGDLGSKS